MPHWIIDIFARYGYAALFIGVFLESLGIPVPGETVLLAAGFFCKQGTLRLGFVIPCAIVAAIFGDNFGYLIGRKGGRSFVERRGKYIGLSPQRLAKVETHFREPRRRVDRPEFAAGCDNVTALVLLPQLRRALPLRVC